jgi:CheY-like chemotaxis protein
VDEPEQSARSVLLVDDDPDLRQIAAVILGELGFHVMEASGAEEAMAILRGPQKVELLLTDLAMPGIGGLELAHLAKRARPELKVLYTSAYVRTSETGPALRHGPLIEKPWRLEQLRQVIERLLGPGKPPATPGREAD